jgi:hypothetical protein
MMVRGGATSIGGMSSGNGLFWVFDNPSFAVPTLPMFTDDANHVQPLLRCLDAAVADAASTSTTAATITEITMDAGSSIAGTTYRLEAFVEYIKTAVNTTDPRFVVQLGGVNIAFVQIDQNTTAGTFYFHVTATFTVRTTGGSGAATYAVGLAVTGTSNATQYAEAIVDRTTGAPATLDTTADQTLSLGVALASTVAGNSIKGVVGTIERVFR